jgi:2-polyprenyl-3-methyl-5-hydroxy-6-metoxy-1,4-benzoquinol methylase
MDVEELKRRVVRYWEKRAADFQEQRLRELGSPLRGRWYAEMTKYLPMGRDLRILDLGTGTGFFSFLLSEKGNMVTGIDLTEEMIWAAADESAEE